MDLSDMLVKHKRINKAIIEYSRQAGINYSVVSYILRCYIYFMEHKELNNARLKREYNNLSYLEIGTKLRILTDLNILEPIKRGKRIYYIQGKAMDKYISEFCLVLASLV